IIMASTSKFGEEPHMWNELVGDYWMDGNIGVSNQHETMFDTGVEADPDLSDWECSG
ncbi:hypothetical protein S245_069959, partial [Arachis hypogaea]